MATRIAGKYLIAGLAVLRFGELAGVIPRGPEALPSLFICRRRNTAFLVPCAPGSLLSTLRRQAFSYYRQELCGIELAGLPPISDINAIHITIQSYYRTRIALRRSHSSCTDQERYDPSTQSVSIESLSCLCLDASGICRRVVGNSSVRAHAYIWVMPFIITYDLP